MRKRDGEREGDGASHSAGASLDDAPASVGVGMLEREKLRRGEQGDEPHERRERRCAMLCRGDSGISDAGGRTESDVAIGGVGLGARRVSAEGGGGGGASLWDTAWPSAPPSAVADGAFSAARDGPTDAASLLCGFKSDAWMASDDDTMVVRVLHASEWGAAGIMAEREGEDRRIASASAWLLREHSPVGRERHAAETEGPHGDDSIRVRRREEERGGGWSCS